MADPDEIEPVQELKHPGWQSIAQVLHMAETFWGKSVYLPGYEFSSNIYVLVGDYLTVVDPGNDYTAFMDLRELGFNPADIKKIVLTHGHQDHALGLFDLLRYPEIIQSGGFELILHEASPIQLKEVTRQAGCRVTEVRGGETLELSGFEWEVIHTPGHTIDGICLYHAPSRTVLTGDMVLPHAMAEPDEAAGGKLNHYLFGLKELLKRDIENLLPGHGILVGPGGKHVVEETYEALLMKIIEVEGPIPWLDGALALAQRGLLEEAVYCCERDLAHHPEDLKALRLKALCLNDLGRCHEALEALDKLIGLSSLESADPFISVARGYALMGLERYAESIQSFDEALRVKPGMRDALMYKGMALYLAGKYDEAMDIEPFRQEFVGRFRQELTRNR